jgi:lipopolysaccharide export system protein LptA
VVEFPEREEGNTVWTPKRVMLLVSGFVVFLAGYVLYARYLGGIDGLPALPECYRYSDDPTPPPPPVVKPNKLQEKLRLAFGEECPELDYAIKLEVDAKGLVVAAKEFFIERDDEPRKGQVRLAPLGVAIFGKDNGDGKFPEINTVRCDRAWLTFDRPITTPADMSKAHIVLAELNGHVEVINNRRSPQRDDDLTIFTPGPVFYKESEHRIWTDDEEKIPVELKDLQSKPDPQRINGIGMDLFLTTETDPSAKPTGPATAKAPASPHGTRTAAKKSKMEAVTGVERIVLHRNVRMDLYLDGDDPFLGTDKSGKPTKSGTAAKTTAPPADAPKSHVVIKTPGPLEYDVANKTAAPPADAPKSHVVIETQGPFEYDVAKMHAQFNISKTPGQWANRVVVNRSQKPGESDQLDCEQLEFQFRSKEGNGPRTVREDRSVELEIESAHATGKEVVLTSDANMLEAFGNDFYYDARTRESTLKGNPEMWALKEGNEIHAPELRLVQQQGAQQVTAIGAGRIALLDKPTGKRPQHAKWTEKLATSRDGAFDLLVLTGDAAFLDDEHHQELRGDILKVWLEPNPEAPAADAKKEVEVKKEAADAAGQKTDGPAEHHGRRPHHVEAVGHVLAKSEDMNIHDCERLVIWFKDAPPAAAGPATASAAPMAPLGGAKETGAAAEKPAAPQGPAVTVATPGTRPMTPTTGAPSATAPADNKPARPIDLKARFVEAHVLRNGSRNDLDRLWTEGDVLVRQEGATPDDKGVRIKGETMQLARKPEGSVLVVSGGGPNDDLGEFLMDKIYIVGPVVNIDQVANKAWVNGIGAMRMDNKSNFQGNQLDHSVPLTVHWNKSMFFDGQSAEFHGGVEAEQENSRLLCQAMQVYLDRPVSLREGEKNGPPAKVSKLVCDQAVRAEDTEWNNGKLVKYQRIDCSEMTVDNEEGEMTAPGPGTVRILQLGDASNDPAGPPKATPRKGNGPPPAEQQLKLTRVTYSGRMQAFNKIHLARFFDNVTVVHVPSEDALLDPNIDKLPEGGLYLRSDWLEVYSRQEPGKPNESTMKGRGHVFFKSADGVAGDSYELLYDQAKDQIIFIGRTGLAHVYRELARGGKQQELKAQKIIYLRRTGEFHADKVEGVTN